MPDKYQSKQKGHRVISLYSLLQGELTSRAPFFNHRAYTVSGYFSRHDFVRKWRRIYARDASFRFSHAGTLRYTLKTLNPHALWLEALSRDSAFPSSGLDLPVATAAIRPDPLDPSHGYLSLLHVVNDRLTLATLLEELAETLYPHGIRTLLGPTHLFPFLGGGALSSHWHLPVPPDTPYQPPYAGEHLGALLRPVETTHLYHFESAWRPGLTPNGVIRKLEPDRLAADLLPLLGHATFPYPVDHTEAKAMLRWLAPYRPLGFSVSQSADIETPAGFVLVYGEPGPTLRHRVPRRGRLWGGVREDARHQGLGQALLHAGLKAALERGWQSVSVGPAPERSDAAAFLQAAGGVPLQRYTLYRRGG